MKLPDGWQFVALGDVADTGLGKMLDRGKSRRLPQVRYLRNVNVQWGRVDTQDLLTMEIDDDERERFGVEPGDLLVCEGGEIGRAAIWRGDGEYIAFQKALHRVRPSIGLDATFLRYFLEHSGSNGTLAALSTGSTIAHLPQHQLRKLQVPLPPQNTQRQIVTLLEEHLSSVEEASRSIQAAQRRTTTYVASAVEALLSGCDRVPAADLIGRIESGKSFGGSAPPAAHEEWGIIKVSSMTWGSFRESENKAIPAERADPRFEIHRGDVLVSRANTSEHVGASVYVENVRPRLLLSDKSLRLTARPGIDQRWLQLALSVPSARRQMSRMATGTKDSMRNISQASLLGVRVPSLSPEDQRRLGQQVIDIREQGEQLKRATEVAQARGLVLRRTLLQSAFSGALTSRSFDLCEAEQLAFA